MIEAGLHEYVALWREAGVEVDLKASLTSPQKTLSDIRAELGDCTRCKLCETRKNIVFGVGAEKAILLFVGEGPGEEEDQQGTPFVGRAGDLLNKIVEAMKLNRASVYIANVVKCRPPENRAPEEEEISSCLPFLRAQIESVGPKVIVALGGTAFSALVKPGIIGNVRGKFWFLPGTDIKVMPTYHPAYLLRNPDAKKMVWDDMKQVVEALKLC